MDCRRAERLFDLYLDREITVADFGDLRHHLSACRRCAENWVATRKMVDLLAALPEEPPGPEVVSRVMMTLPGAKRRTYFRLAAWQAAASVAAFLVMLGGAYLSGSQRMIAAAVENRGGQTVVIPHAGRPLVIPPGAVVMGDLRVDGDVYVQGQVEGKIAARSVTPARLTERTNRPREPC